MTKKFIIVVSVPESENGRAEWAERVRAIIAGATIFVRASAKECSGTRADINGAQVVDVIKLSAQNLIANMQHFAFGYAANGFGLLMVPRNLVREALCAEEADCLAVPCGTDNRPQSARPVRSHEELCALIGEPVGTGPELLAPRSARSQGSSAIATPTAPSLQLKPALSASQVGQRSGVSLEVCREHRLGEAVVAA